MTKRVLVTGGSGTLGARLIPFLETQGYHIVLLSREPQTTLQFPSVTYIRADLTDKNTLKEKLSEVEFDAVLHLAAVTHSHNKDTYFRVNTEGTRNLVDICSTKPGTRFVYMSSRAANTGGGAYAESKLAGEVIVKNSGLDWVILRPSEVYGGSNHEALSRLVRWMLRYHLAPIIGSGGYRVAPVWIDDVIQATAHAVSLPEARHKIYTLSGPEEYPYNELVRRMARSLHIRVLRVHIPIPLARALARLASLLGWTTIVNDQIDRLMTEKISDISDAQRDLNFNPCILSEGLRKILPSENNSL